MNSEIHCGNGNQKKSEWDSEKLPMIMRRGGHKNPWTLHLTALYTIECSDKKCSDIK